MRKTFIAPLPDEFKNCGEFAPSVKALVITLYRDSGMTEPSIERFLKTFGLKVSHGKISAWLVEDNEPFHAEKEAIIDAGIQASVFQQMDDTGSRVKGKNYYTHILCNDFFTAYFTRKSKDRLTLLSLLCRDKLNFLMNEKTYELMTEFGLSEKWLACIKPMLKEDILTREAMDNLLKILFQDATKNNASRHIILESAALAYYQQSEYYIQFLMTDDAPQFNKLSMHHILCWIHEGRHYKKLTPFADMHQKILDLFLDQFWDYYDLLLKYKESPLKENEKQLSDKFDTLFSTTTGYGALDKRIAITRSKKSELLLVLENPFLPLHNNDSELGAECSS